MTDLFLKLLDRSVSASLLVLVVIVLRFLMKKAPGWIHCLLWAMVAVRLICPISLESSLSLVPQRQEVTMESLRSTVEIEVHTAGEYVPAKTPASESPSPLPAETPSSSHADTPLTRTILPNLTAVWFAGMSLMLVYAFESYWRIRKKVDISIDLGDGVCICDYIDSPFILGIFKPRICLPSTLSSRDADHVLAHERAHLQRRDHWWKPLGYLLLAVYWFNPLIWAAYILLCRDIELACDQRVVKKMDTAHRKAYSEALLNCSLPRHMIAACPLAFGEVGVKERVKSVLHYKKPAFWIILVAIVACIAVAVCFLTDPKEDSSEETAASLFLDDTALEPLYGEHPLLAEYDWSEVAEQAEATRLTLFDPQTYGDYLFVGCQYDGEYGVAVLVSKEYNLNGKYQLCHFAYGEGMNILEDGGAVQTYFQHNTLEASMYVILDESITGIEWYGVDTLTASVDHYPALVFLDHADYEDTLEHFYFERGDQTLEADTISSYRFWSHSGEIYSTQNYSLFSIENDLLFPEAHREHFTRISGQMVFYFDGESRPGYFRLADTERNSLKELLEAVPESALSEYEGDINCSVCVDLSFQGDIHQEDDSTTLSLHYRDGEVKCRLAAYEGDGVYKTLSAYRIDYEPLTQFLTFLCDASRREAYVNILSVEGPIAYSYLYANMSVTRLVDWEYEIVEYTDDKTPFGIRGRPAYCDEGWLFLSFWPSGFDADSCAEGTVAAPYGESNLKGWTYMPLNGFEDYVLINEGADEWLDSQEYNGYYNRMLSGSCASGILSQEDIKKAAHVLYSDVSTHHMTAEFDWKNGIWTVFIPENGNFDTIHTLQFDYKGNILSTDDPNLIDMEAQKEELQELLEKLQNEYAQ